ncbi:MAG: transcriptional regulator [Piscirickettsiaceae bacterium CG_4_9_14_3_um_filter_43_564]|nr:ROK family protein [Thiomicrospira sp.]OIP96823.1 MAG: transcriptional regulator [Thiomicrospira sp. CG2_30_44_34]PIQ04718.1 MAG: transcriptional regulator [Piscirickettsiaceae bacterium CG18_big_fil_WC_8_21_14_2_50_44_103]PIU39344.1 MAG: transcriptional regulator [Piscirickettsiaceae bacterium CG07_land_8_20_14_0_80_44_28]PIW56728.1 MAG: transcriptional regulator [Piscirickettsiaceae bacterium CG12_big_fil_rev_8_21_14_0_65_44_934]PIW77819.1 MAG: transcriptional regulator [Piscirickettsiace
MKVGIDLGGTKIEVAVLDENNQLAFRQRVATPQGNYDATCQAIVDLVTQVQQPFGHFNGVGIGIPGAISKKTGRIKNANSTCLIGRDLQADLQVALDMKVVLANDANCLALSEASDGAAAGEEVVFAVIVGTGCGGGLVVNGQVINGTNAIAGEWGHNPMPWLDSAVSRPSCYCGLKGCIETYLSGPALSSHFFAKTGRSVTAQQLVELAEQDDDAAQAMLETYANWMAKALASVINVVDPDVIVLGGGVSKMQFLYQRVPQLWQQWVFSDLVETRLVPAKWGDSSGVRGAAWLGSNQKK